jgi:hypothetical protein
VLVAVLCGKKIGGNTMQDAPSATPEQVFPFGIGLTILLIAVVAVALIWFIKRTRGGRRAP